MLSIAILAGGLATRLRPITEKTPKALVEVAGKPFVFWQLEELARQGATKVVLCVGYLGEQVEQAVGDGRQFGLEVAYSYDGDFQLGTGGAIKQALPLLGEHFFVLYGDSFLPIDYQAVERAYFANDLPGLMTVLHNGNQWDKSNVYFNQGALLEYNKREPRPEMSFIDYGLGVLSSTVFDAYMANCPLDLADVYHALSTQGRLAGLEVFDRFYEMGSHKGLRETTEYLLSRKQA